MIFAVLALIVYPPLILLAVIVGIVATIHYFATNKNPQESAFAFVLLLIGIAIVGGLYAWLGAVGAVIGIFAILAFVGMTS
ncbi:MAG TPA: hypothetical protein VE974_25620 [Thermoanaerobaculia bacterium]|nr:hypothetical protein [Thermoanaerobaculia bacterium]